MLLFVSEGCQFIAIFLRCPTLPLARCARASIWRRAAANASLIATSTCLWLRSSEGWWLTTSACRVHHGGLLPTTALRCFDVSVALFSRSRERAQSSLRATY